METTIYVPYESRKETVCVYFINGACMRIVPATSTFVIAELLINGKSVAVETSEHFHGQWKLEYNGEKYVAHVWYTENEEEEEEIVEEWKEKEIIVSYWKKEGVPGCKVTRTRCISNVTGEQKDFFELGGWQPFPIKGKFESTYGYIASWLIRNGYKQIREVRYI